MCLSPAGWGPASSFLGAPGWQVQCWGEILSLPWPGSHKSLSFAGVELQVAELGRYYRVWGLALLNFGSVYGTTWGPWRPLSTAGVAQVIPWNQRILGLSWPRIAWMCSLGTLGMCVLTQCPGLLCTQEGAQSDTPGSVCCLGRVGQHCLVRRQAGSGHSVLSLSSWLLPGCTAQLCHSRLPLQSLPGIQLGEESLLLGLVGRDLGVWGPDTAGEGCWNLMPLGSPELIFEVTVGQRPS